MLNIQPINTQAYAPPVSEGGLEPKGIYSAFRHVASDTVICYVPDNELTRRQ